MNRTRATLAAVLGAALALSACSAGGTDKSGGTTKNLIPTIGTPDHEGQPGAAHVKDYVAKVTDLSDGRIKLRPRWEVAGESDDWDQKAARMVEGGDLDLAVIPARTWDTEGVSTLRPLQAPFLLTSDQTLDAALGAGVTKTMLAGLDKAGVTGLGLFPEAFRYLYGFDKQKPRTLDDLQRLRSRTPRSKTTYAVHAALGLKPDDPNGEAFAQALADGEIDVLEGSFLTVPGADAGPVTGIGNLPLYPKVNTLVANSTSWDRLDKADRDLLARAAGDLQEEYVSRDLQTSEQASLKDFCSRHAIVQWDDREVAAARKAAEPVFDELRSDEAAGKVLKTLQQLAGTAGGDPVSMPSCSGAEDASAPADDAKGDQSVLDGTYRFTIPAKYLADRGANDHEVAINSGVATVSLKGGEYTLTLRSPEEPSTEHGKYTVDGQSASFYLSWIPTSEFPEGLRWKVGWKRTAGGDLVFSVDKVREPLIDALFVAAPWKKVS